MNLAKGTTQRIQEILRIMNNVQQSPNTMVEKNYEEIQFNCPWPVQIASYSNFVITYMAWTWMNKFKLEIHFHPVSEPETRLKFQIKKKTYLYASLAAALAKYEMNPEPHLTNLDLHVLGELTSVMDVTCGKYHHVYLQQLGHGEQ